MKATLAYGFAHATCGSPPFPIVNCCSRRPAGESPTRFAQRNRLQGLIQIRGEDRNRTYLATCVATTVLKTARATRHPSLSGLQKTPNAQRPTSDAEFFAREARFGVRRKLDAAFERPTTSHGLRTYKRLAGYFAFLIALTISSKSGHSPDSSLEWSSLPLARISKAPPLDGISVSDLMRSPSSRILVAKLTAFGV